jgi:hypothetical protein
MSRKIDLLMLTTLAMLSDRDIGIDNHLDLDYHKQRQKELAEQSNKYWMKSQGINEYYYGENVLFARSQKNADKKAKKKGYL